MFQTQFFSLKKKNPPGILCLEPLVHPQPGRRNPTNWDDLVEFSELRLKLEKPFGQSIFNDD